MLPAAVVILVNLLSARAWRLAAGWALWFGAAMILVVVTKLAFIGWGIGNQSWDFTGLSGHATRACAVLPVFGYLICQTADARCRTVGVGIGTILGLLIAFSRIAVHVHSVAEAASGALLGLLVAAIFVRAARRFEMPGRGLWLTLAALAGLLVNMVGEPAPSQQMLTGIALTLSGHSRPFTRADWTRVPRGSRSSARSDNLSS